MNKIIMIRIGEIMLKGLNRKRFINQLIKNIRYSLNYYNISNYKIITERGRIYVEPTDDSFDFTNATLALKKVFGIVSISIVSRINSSMKEITNMCLKQTKCILDKNNYKTFRVNTKRADKTFPIKSMDVSSKIGGEVLKEFESRLEVDLHNPDFILNIEIRDKTYIFSDKISCSGGLPVHSSSKAMLLLSGGIDSPVAGHMVSKRGVKLEAIHFYSYPYTSQRAKKKVISLAKILSIYNLGISIHIIPFTDIQLYLRDNFDKELLTILMRRIMMKIANKLAEKNNCKALITGESIGQVASQTMEALNVTNNIVNMPVFRPLIGFDKIDIVKYAKGIETFETSILPYEDCCTIFVAKHPKTRPNLEEILKVESKYENIEEMIEESINNREIIDV